MATTTFPERTRDEIDALKRDWQRDPCWDIEETEGFEAHREELEEFHAEMEAVWTRRRNMAAAKKAEELGCPNNLALGNYVLSLERRIERLEARVGKLDA